MAGLWFEEFKDGMVFNHEWSRTITETDNMWFSLLTMNVQPLHIDSAYGYPTQGRGMLRIFCNIDPLDRPRVWQLGETGGRLVAHPAQRHTQAQRDLSNSQPVRSRPGAGQARALRRRL